jgi:hypothetical protein
LIRRKQGRANRPEIGCDCARAAVGQSTKKPGGLFRKKAGVLTALNSPPP